MKGMKGIGEKEKRNSEAEEQAQLPTRDSRSVCFLKISIPCIP
jgi:hypothetical protein